MQREQFSRTLASTETVAEHRDNADPAATQARKPTDNVRHKRGKHGATVVEPTGTSERSFTVSIRISRGRDVNVNVVHKGLLEKMFEACPGIVFRPTSTSANSAKRPISELEHLPFDTFGRDIHDVVQDMSNPDDILLVSDGGAAYKCGSYGWVLGTKAGRRIAQGSGTVFGYDPMSYCAEISGSRAGLLFICHAVVYCTTGAFPAGCLSVYCDNSCFITKVATLREYSLALTAHCLDAEWDLLVSVMELLANFPTPPSVNHIQGHQDRHCDYNSLDLISQMNVDADALASYELAEYSMIHPIVPFEPTSLVLLHTVTHNIEAAVRDKLFLTPLGSYYCTRFQWSSATYESINWDAYAMAYSAHPRSRKFFYQFGWKKLPCGGRLHAREPRFADRCPFCLQP